MRKFLPFFLFLTAAAPGPNTIQCTASCTAPDGTTQPAGTNLSYILCGSDSCASWLAGGGLPPNTTLIAGQIAPLYTPPAPTPTPATIAAQLLAGGLTVTSTSTPALSGTYAIDPASRATMSEISTFAIVNSSFPGGDTQPYLDMSGNPHVFTSTTEWLAFATAVARVVNQLTLFGAGQGAQPAMTATIP